MDKEDWLMVWLCINIYSRHWAVLPWPLTSCSPWVQHDAAHWSLSCCAASHQGADSYPAAPGSPRSPSLSHHAGLCLRMSPAGVKGIEGLLVITYKCFKMRSNIRKNIIEFNFNFKHVVKMQRKLFTPSLHCSPGHWHHSCIWRAPWHRPHVVCSLPHGGPSSEPYSPHWWRRPSLAAAPWSQAGFCQDMGRCKHMETGQTKVHREVKQWPRQCKEVAQYYFHQVSWANWWEKVKWTWGKQHDKNLHYHDKCFPML